MLLTLHISQVWTCTCSRLQERKYRICVESDWWTGVGARTGGEELGFACRFELHENCVICVWQFGEVVMFG